MPPRLERIFCMLTQMFSCVVIIALIINETIMYAHCLYSFFLLQHFFTNFFNHNYYYFLYDKYIVSSTESQASLQTPVYTCGCIILIPKVALL